MRHVTARPPPRRFARLVRIAPALLAVSCVADVSPDTPGSFAFAVFGDGPYRQREESRFARVLAGINAEPLAWMLHVGDILDGPCSDSVFQARRDSLLTVRHPVVYTPGDNEWTDCWQEDAGGYAPLERLSTLRALFFADPTRSLGGGALTLTSQRPDVAHAEFLENARWVSHGVVFATVHVVGSRNGMRPFPGRTAYEDREVVRRTAAAIVWVQDAFATARAIDAKAVVIAGHANVLEVSAWARRTFDPYVRVLEEETEAFGRPVLLIHGDTHRYRVDHPLQRRTTGRTLANFTRLETFGSPTMGWVRVVVDTGTAGVFRFEPKSAGLSLF